MRRFFIILALIVLFLLGLKSLVLQFPWAWSHARYADFVHSISPGVRVLIALLIFLLPLGLAVEAWLHHPARRKLELHSRAGGKLELRQSVIEKIVRQSVAELPEIERIRVAAATTKNGLRVRIRVKARDVHNVPALDEAIRSRADQSLRRILGIEEIQGVDVQLVDLSSTERASAGATPITEPPYPPARAPLAEPGASASGDISLAQEEPVSEAWLPLHPSDAEAPEEKEEQTPLAPPAQEEEQDHQA